MCRCWIRGKFEASYGLRFGGEGVVVERCVRYVRKG